MSRTRKKETGSEPESYEAGRRTHHFRAELRKVANLNDEGLAACPFCGSKAAEVCSGVGEFWVLCTHCKASSGMKNSKADAVEAWEQRVKAGDGL